MWVTRPTTACASTAASSAAGSWGRAGNLGFTQRGRIDYALSGGPEGDGGRINTDAIDNVAGVNTSDHEVNIKILLDAGVREERLSAEERNQLLVDMTDTVCEHVLYGSYTQTQAISLALAQAAPMIDVHQRLIRYLEQVAGSGSRARVSAQRGCDLRAQGGPPGSDGARGRGRDGLQQGLPVRASARVRPPG